MAVDSILPMAAPYKFMGLQVHGPNKYLWDTLYHKNRPTGQPPASDDDSVAAAEWDDDKFEAAKKTILSTTSFPAPRFFKATLHQQQLKHGDTTLTLPANLGQETADFSSRPPIPAIVILVSHMTVQDQKSLHKDLYMLASNTVHQMRKGNEHQWWAAAVIMMTEYQPMDSFPFSDTQS